MVTTRRGRCGGDVGELGRLVCVFDDERAVANAGLVLASTLAGQLGIEQVVDEVLDLGQRAGAARPGRKLLTLVCSALVGGDSIEDAGVLRCGETERVLAHRVMAPSTLGRARQAGCWLRLHEAPRLPPDPGDPRRHRRGPARTHAQGLGR